MRITTQLLLAWLLGALSLGCSKDQETLPAASTRAVPTSGAAVSSSAGPAAPAALPAALRSRQLPRWPLSAGSAAAVASAAPSAAASAAPNAQPVRVRALSPTEAEALLPAGQPAAYQLLDAGAPPHAVRHYRAEQPQRRAVTVSLDAVVRVQRGGETAEQPVPSMRIEVDTQVTAVDGGLQLRATIGEVVMQARDEAARAVVAEMQPLVSKAKGLAGVLRVNQQGVAATAPAPPQGTPRELLQLWSSVAEALLGMVVAMPYEPIGVGARWRLLDRVRRSGVVMIRDSELRLESASGGQLQVVGSVRELGQADGAQDAALGPDVKLEVLAAVAIGTRRVHIWGAELVPLTSAVETAADMRLRVTPKLGRGAEPVTSTVKLTQLLNTVRKP